MNNLNTTESYRLHSTLDQTKPSLFNSLRFSDESWDRYNADEFVRASGSSGHVVKVDELFSLFQSAKLFSVGVDYDQLRSAFTEAVRLKHSGLFPDYINPQVAVDEYGEFMFTYKNAIGYIDIGLSGEGEISYHARNDTDPESTVYGDVEWNGLSLPNELIEGVTPILNY